MIGQFLFSMMGCCGHNALRSLSTNFQTLQNESAIGEKANLKQSKETKSEMHEKQTRIKNKVVISQTCSLLAPLWE